jgi:hypothetical protein
VPYQELFEAEIWIRHVCNIYFPTMAAKLVDFSVKAVPLALNL